MVDVLSAATASTSDPFHDGPYRRLKRCWNPVSYPMELIRISGCCTDVGISPRHAAMPDGWGLAAKAGNGAVGASERPPEVPA